jgi:hypothetical protein
MNTLWSGGGSMDTWSGPAGANVETDANWFYQLSGGTAMAGYCSAPSMGAMTCPLAADQVVLTGTSSAGPFQWESNLFNCILMTGP